MRRSREGVRRGEKGAREVRVGEGETLPLERSQRRDSGMTQM